MSLATSGHSRTEPLILVEEISHRVVNEYAEAIASISLASANIVDVDARAALVNAMRRLRDQAQAHRVLQPPTARGEVDVGDYLSGICAALSTAGLRDRSVRLSLIQDDIAIDAARCWRVGLIVAELINNAVRHGFKGGPGEIVVVVGAQDAQVRCRVSDNGSPTHDFGLGRGRRVAQALAAELGGDLEWLASPGGTTVLLNFPVQSQST